MKKLEEKRLTAFNTYQHALDTSQGYADFFNSVSQKQDCSKIENVPLSNKATYVSQYSISELKRTDFPSSDQYAFTTSSGSTGQPTIWPKSKKLDQKSTKFLRDHLVSELDLAKKNTLVINAFPINTSVAGMDLLRISWELNTQFDITTVTSGVDFAAMLAILKETASQFDQIIIFGYPPAMIELCQYFQSQKYTVPISTHFYVSGEKTSSELATAVSMVTKTNSVTNVYGCAESGLLGIETQVCKKIEKQLTQNPSMCNTIFGTTTVPTIVEGNWENYYFEEVDGSLVITSDQPIPLIRYDLQDKCRLLNSDDVAVILSEQIELHFPLIAVFGRTSPDRVISVEDIRESLISLNSPDIITTEFQYKETQKKSGISLELVLYYQRKTSVDLDQLSKLLHSRHPNQKLEVQLRLLSEKKRKSYTSGKNKYYL